MDMVVGGFLTPKIFGVDVLSAPIADVFERIRVSMNSVNHTRVETVFTPMFARSAGSSKK